MKFIKSQGVSNGKKKKLCLRHKYLVNFFGYFGLPIVKQIILDSQLHMNVPFMYTIQN
jgi:FMN-dependent NADH-azoreductase